VETYSRLILIRLLKLRLLKITSRIHLLSPN